MLTWRVHRTLDDPLKREPRVWRGLERLLGVAEIPTEKAPLTKMQMVRSSAVLVMSAPFVSAGLIAAFFPAPLLALLLSVVYGVLTVLRVSSHIAGEHRRHTYELLCALPAGKITVHWICAAHWFQVSQFTRRVLRGALTIGLVASPFLFGGWAYPITGRRAVEFWLVDTVAFGVFLIYDYFNTRVIATLIGMLTPAITRKSHTIRVLSLGMFLLITIATYLIGAAIVLMVLPALLMRANASAVAYVIIAPITVTVVIAFREAITLGLWRLLEWSLHTTPSELEEIIR